MQRYLVQEGLGLFATETPRHVGLFFRTPSQDFVKIVEELQRLKLLCPCVMK